MNRTDIARAISEDLLSNDTLNEHDYVTDKLLSVVQDIILEHMKDYILFVRHNIISCMIGTISSLRKEIANNGRLFKVNL